MMKILLLLVSLKELRSQLKVEEDILNEVTKQVPLKSAMMAYALLPHMTQVVPLVQRQLLWVMTHVVTLDNILVFSYLIFNAILASFSVLTYAISKTLFHSNNFFF